MSNSNNWLIGYKYSPAIDRKSHVDLSWKLTLSTDMMPDFTLVWPPTLLERVGELTCQWMFIVSNYLKNISMKAFRNWMICGCVLYHFNIQGLDCHQSWRFKGHSYCIVKLFIYSPNFCGHVALKLLPPASGYHEDKELVRYLVLGASFFLLLPAIISLLHTYHNCRITILWTHNLFALF